MIEKYRTVSALPIFKADMIIPSFIFQYKINCLILLFLLLFTLGFATDKKVIAEVLFEGNHQITSKLLLDKIQQKPKGILNQTIYNNRAVKLDEITLRSFYLSEGFLDVDINHTLKKYKTNSVNIIYHINEGVCYYINSIEIQGNHLFTAAEILNILDLKIDDPYNLAKIQANINNLKYEYARFGKLKMNIIEEDELLKGRIDIRFTLAEGQIYSIGNIIVTGLETKPEKYILRELVFTSGEKYNIYKIEKSQKRIFSSGLFSSIEMYPHESTTDAQIINIEIRVREYRSKSIQFDLGFSQAPSSRGEGAPPATIFGLETKWQPGTLLNSANRIEIGGNIGLRLDENISFPPKDFYINWFSPWNFGFKIPLRLKYFYQEQRDENTLLTQGIETSFLYRLSERRKLSGTLSLEYVQADEENIEINTELERRLELNYLKQKLDSFINPTSGYYSSFAITLNGTILGGRKHYLKIDSEYKEFRKIYKNVVWGYRLKAGCLYKFELQSDDLELAFYDKFWLGGNTSLRGWKTPQDYNDEGSIIRFQANTELRFPLFWRFGGELFWDAGKLADDHKENLISSWGWDVGAGLTFMTPIGPIRLDYAYPEAKNTRPTVLLSLLFMF